MWRLRGPSATWKARERVESGQMAQAQSVNMAARAAAGFGFLCGVLGLIAGVTEHVWKLGPTGWFAGGALLTLLALFSLLEGSITERG